MVVYIQDRLLRRELCPHEEGVNLYCEDCITNELDEAEAEWWDQTSPVYWRWLVRLRRAA